MSKPLTIMFDIDGVLADFVLGVTSLANQEYPHISPRTSDDQETWSFDGIMGKKQFDKLLDQIKVSSDFWACLPMAPRITPVDMGRIYVLDRIHKVYFVTSRIESGNTLQQTRDWLRIFVDHPNVILSKKKGEVARVIGADYSIEDKWDNAQCIHWLSDSPQTKSYLIDRPYNRVPGVVGAEKVRRVTTIKEFLDDVEERK